MFNFFKTVGLVWILATPTISHSESLGSVFAEASGARWYSSYLNLNPARDFKKGDLLRINVEGDAETVVVRLLPNSANPGQSTGTIGTRKPEAGLIEITLSRDHSNIKQISIHSGKEAWGRRLGENNGTARLVGVTRLTD